MNPKLKTLYLRLKEIGVDGLVVSSAQNISYLTQVPSRDAHLIVSPKGNTYLTDARYILEVRKWLCGCTVKEVKNSRFQAIADSFRQLGLTKVGFEEGHFTFAEYQKLRRQLDSRVSLVPTRELIEDLRMIKTPEELLKIRQATQIALSALDFIRPQILPGRTELEIAGELERFIRYQGADSSSFEMIVAAGPNSSCPHHLTGSRKIKKDDLVLIDLGADFSGYKSDLTRVFFLGKINPLGRRIYAIVAEAQAQAFRSIKPGVPAREIDRACRQFLSRKGYAKNFLHNTGHGVGLQVHEAPRISQKEDRRLMPGMVFTVEPGIYLAGKFGIRLEDMVLVTKKGAEVISGTGNK